MYAQFLPPSPQLSLETGVPVLSASSILSCWGLRTEVWVMIVQGRSCPTARTPGLNLVGCRSRQFPFFKKSSLPCHFSVNISYKGGAWTLKKKKSSQSCVSDGVGCNAAGLDRWVLFHCITVICPWEAFSFRDPSLSCRLWRFSCKIKSLKKKPEVGGELLENTAGERILETEIGFFSHVRELQYYFVVPRFCSTSCHYDIYLSSLPCFW